jgi:uncharacterized protein YcaQ
VKLSKADARRAFVRYHFEPCSTPWDAFERLRSIQFDPIAPVGCNHDLVLQARVRDYRIGEWERLAYDKRRIYDGWDKQASLVPFEGWPWRRIFHRWHRDHFTSLLSEYAEAAEAILKDIEGRGPLLPKECGFQAKRSEWKGTWFSPNVTKRVLRALWHTGEVMTAGRLKGQHVYDLTERVVPGPVYASPFPEEDEAVRELLRERHRAVGLLRPSASAEVWSYKLYAGRNAVIGELADRGKLARVDIEGALAHASPHFLPHLDTPPLEPRVVFVAPLDQFVWDRKMIAHLFGFDYKWEIYVPEAKRRWGYYVLPVLFGDRLVARAEFWCRGGVLEIRRWHFEPGDPGQGFFDALGVALRDFAHYGSALRIESDPSVDSKVRDVAARALLTGR